MDGLLSFLPGIAARVRVPRCPLRHVFLHPPAPKSQHETLWITTYGVAPQDPDGFVNPITDAQTQIR